MGQKYLKPNKIWRKSQHTGLNLGKLQKKDVKDSRYLATIRNMAKSITCNISVEGKGKDILDTG